MTTTTARAAAPQRSFELLQPVWRLLTSVRIAVYFISALSLIGLAGVLIPQVPEAMRGNAPAVNMWLETQRGTFGPLTEPMYRLGLFSVFQAQWFRIALAYLVVNVTVCVFNRWSPTFRNVFHPPERVPDSFFARAHNRTRFDAVAPAAAASALRALRYSVRTREDAGATYIFADRFGWAQLATFVSHLALILFIAGGLVTSLTGFTAAVVAGEGTTVPVFAVKDPNQMQVRIDDATSRFGERGNALDFRTQVTIFRNGEEVKSGTITVNDPLEYGGYRFHQVSFLPNGAALRVRDAATGNTVLAETFPLEQTTAAPSVTITDAGGTVLLEDVIAPTAFLDIASGALVAVPDTDRIIWVGMTSIDDEWQLVAYDPQAGGSDAGQLRVALGEQGAVSGLRVRFDRVASIPSATVIGIPGSDSAMLAQLTDAPDGGKALMLVAEDRPAMSLAEGEPLVVQGYEYTFEGPREFTGIAVKRDAGVWFIWIATGLLLLGLVVTFYVPRRRLWLRLTGEGTEIAALAEKSGGFANDMRALAHRLGMPAPPDVQEER